MPSTADAAQTLDRSPQHVRWLCRQGVLFGAYRRGRDWWIPRAAIDAYSASRRTEKEHNGSAHDH